MWTRGEVKEWAKAALHRNYWKIVLVSALLVMLGCGAGGFSFHAKSYSGRDEMRAQEQWAQQGTEKAVDMIMAEDSFSQKSRPTFWETLVIGGIAIVIFLAIAFVVFAVVLCIDIFLLNPLLVGGCRFMVKSVWDVAQVKEIAFGFDHNYKNVVKVLFFRDLYVFLWALLLIIPGIVKMYEYYMVPYILTEYPDMEYKEALQMSRDMMEGNKWKTFVLGLSFILWDLLGTLTLGIVEVFYVHPYRQLTYAALYCKLRDLTAMNSMGQPQYGNYYENQRFS